MSLEEHLIAGENIYLEKKGDDVVIHCSPEAAPFRNMHGGFFRLDSITAEDTYPRLTLSNCIFRLNGRYIRLEDYEIIFSKNASNYIYLRLYEDPVYCRIEHYIYDNYEDEEIKDDDAMILLYIIRENNFCVQVETFSAGNLIDTNYLHEGFVYMHHEKGLRTTVMRRPASPDEHDFSDNMQCYFVPSYDPVTDEGVNICIPYAKGGVLEGGIGEDFYMWNSTGLPDGNVDIYIMISSEGAYYAKK